MTQPLHISSLVVRADPRQMPEVLAELATIAAAEVALQDPSGKIVVLIEADTEDQIGSLLTRIQVLPGVASAALVFHHSPDSSDIDQPEGISQ